MVERVNLVEVPDGNPVVLVTAGLHPIPELTEPCAPKNVGPHRAFRHMQSSQTP